MLGRVTVDLTGIEDDDERQEDLGFNPPSELNIQLTDQCKSERLPKRKAVEAEVLVSVQRPHTMN